MGKKIINWTCLIEQVSEALWPGSLRGSILMDLKLMANDRSVLFEFMRWILNEIC